MDAVAAPAAANGHAYYQNPEHSPKIDWEWALLGPGAKTLVAFGERPDPVEGDPSRERPVLQIWDAEQGVEIDRKQIQLDEPIKSLGVHSVPVRLHADVRPEVKVWVIKED